MGWHRRRDWMELVSMTFDYDPRSLLTPSSGGQRLSLGHQEGGVGKPFIHGQGKRA